MIIVENVGMPDILAWNLLLYTKKSFLQKITFPFSRYHPPLQQLAKIAKFQFSADFCIFLHFCRNGVLGRWLHCQGKDRMTPFGRDHGRDARATLGFEFPGRWFRQRETMEKARFSIGSELAFYGAEGKRNQDGVWKPLSYSNLEFAAIMGPLSFVAIISHKWEIGRKPLAWLY